MTKDKSSTIQLLPTELANQIAAGEVVERPSSVLKELIENSLDAQATSISATIEDGGQTSIRVSDNGIGIAKEELSLAVTRHATSKIKNIHDLSNISSFGFRGEALPSIASVSDFSIASYLKNNKEEQGYELRVIYGEMGKVQPCSLTVGTKIEVRNLFNNIPARLKFLKTPSTELKRAQEIFTRIALIQSDKGFEFFAGTREVVNFSLRDSIQQRLAKIWNPAITSNMLEVDANHYDDIRIQGLISDPRSLYAKADKLLIYINKRPVTDKILTRAIRQAYQSSLTTKDYPQVLLNIDIHPEEVDVNVHPAKSEVRFRDEQRIFKAVYTAIEKTLSKKLFFNREAEHPLFTQENQTQNRNSEYFTQARHAEKFTQNQEEIERQKDFLQAQVLYNATNSENIAKNEIVSSSVNFADIAQEIVRFKEQDLEYPDFTSTNTISTHQENTNTLHESPDPKFFQSFIDKGFFGFSGKVEESEHVKPLGFFGEASKKQQQEYFSSQESFSKEQEILFEDNHTNKNFSTKNPFFLYQVSSTYLLYALASTELFILDQHAVHERILFEKLSKKEELSLQRLLLPLTLSLHESELEAFYTLEKDLQHIGFSCEIDQEARRLTCHAIPQNFQHASAEKFLRQALKNEEFDILPSFMDAACDAALKANQRITSQEALELYRQWALCEEPDFCPHGRPCYIIVDKKLLEKLFKRV